MFRRALTGKTRKTWVPKRLRRMTVMGLTATTAAIILSAATGMARAAGSAPVTRPDAKKVFYTNGPASAKKVALSFDDGPHSQYTPQVLDILKRNNARATFFVLGCNVPKNTELLQRMKREGNEIGNHSWSHVNFARARNARQKYLDEIRRTDEAILNSAGFFPKLIRPPYGAYTAWMLETERKNGHVLVNWTFGCDWKKLNAAELLANYSRALRPGAILLMHDGGKDRSATVEMLEALIKSGKEKGYEFVPVGELIGVDSVRKE